MYKTDRAKFAKILSNSIKNDSITINTLRTDSEIFISKNRCYKLNYNLLKKYNIQ